MLIYSEKMLISGELIYFLDLLQGRYRCTKFHHCRICVTDFREGDHPKAARKDRSWIGLNYLFSIRWSVSYDKSYSYLNKYESFLSVLSIYVSPTYWPYYSLLPITTFHLFLVKSSCIALFGKTFTWSDT